ncbi:MAG: hypothetical protein HS116_27615 [Planctomycetes bacterium]|nr:hypothetical protein [Planctomycetota bacterium]
MAALTLPTFDERSNVLKDLPLQARRRLHEGRGFLWMLIGLMLAAASCPLLIFYPYQVGAGWLAGLVGLGAVAVGMGWREYVQRRAQGLGARFRDYRPLRHAQIETAFAAVILAGLVGAVFFRVDLLFERTPSWLAWATFFVPATLAPLVVFARLRFVEDLALAVAMLLAGLLCAWQGGAGLPWVFLMLGVALAVYGGSLHLRWRRWTRALATEEVSV